MTAAMLATESVTQWIDKLRDGDSQAATHLWDRYFTRLVQLARQRLGKMARRAYDEEDVVLDVLDSVCRGLDEGRYPELENRQDLWRLLFTITLRKSVSRLRHEGRQRRGGGRVWGESLEGSSQDFVSPSLAELPTVEPSPDVVAELTELFEALMDKLGDATLRRIARLKLEGYTDEEIAAQIGCVRRTVVRKLKVIRGIWYESIGGELDPAQR
jgi:DNA-directed RNA polymerase specialized sigma24 family protein